MTALWLRLRQERANAAAVLRALNVYLPPIEPERLARQLGVPVHAMLIDFPGMLDATNQDAPCIYVRADDHPLLRRFTVAHNIGHILHDPLGVTYRSEIGPMPYSAIEVRANHFATELLMPEFLMNVSLNYGSMAAAATYLGVSEAAYKIRYEQVYKR